MAIKTATEAMVCFIRFTQPARVMQVQLRPHNPYHLESPLIRWRRGLKNAGYPREWRENHA